ncbi:hypothetical protein AX16_002427 [Volvariella volvacea WC 439]|nr:hypothetical protein AX16_002427 [Volvariella volvacea WC 439]
MAVLKGLKKRYQARGIPPALIHTSGTGELTDSAGGLYPYETVYDDADPDQIETLPPTQLHRNVDLEIVKADQEGYVRTYIVLPSTIYGIAKGKLVDLGIQNPHSLQIPGLIRASLDRGRAGMVGLGKNLWPNVNIEEVGELYYVLFNSILSNPTGTPHGREGYYFGESGEHSLYDIGKAIGQAMVGLGLTAEAEPTTFTKAELDKYFGGSDYLGSNSRCKASRARALGWKPKKTTADMLASIHAEVVVLSSRKYLFFHNLLLPEQTESIERANKLAAEHGVDLSQLQKIMDMSAESITANVLAMNSNCPDDRMKFIFSKLIQHLHDFVRETTLTSQEWMTAIQFLTETGKKCTDVRQEFILLSDTLGVSTLVDSINNAKPPGATEATVLGPFYTEDAHELANGSSIASEGKGDYLFVEGRVLDTQGNPIPGTVINTWETDGHGLYDTQYTNREEPGCRGRLHSAQDGSYSFRAVVPVPYPIPSDGPVGKMVSKLGRHVFRPAHLHFMIEASGYEKLITALFLKDDPYLTSDAVFGVRTSLIVDPVVVEDEELARTRGFKETCKPHAYLKHDFVLATPKECEVVRKNATKQ